MKRHDPLEAANARLGEANARFQAMRALPLLLLVAACTMYGDPAQHEANIISPTNFMAGTAEIYSVAVVSGKTPTLYRLFLRTDKGHQTVDVDKGNFIAGEWIELTNDGRVVRLSGTSLNQSLRRE